MKEQVVKNWRTVRLGDLFDLKYGYGLTAQSRTHGNVPVYGSSGIVGFHDSAVVNSSGVVVGRKGNVGAIHYSPVPFYPIDTVYFVDETKQKSDLHFLYYLLSRVPFKQIGSDVGVPGLNRDLAYQLEVNIPEDIKEQKRIAGVLATFDDKIENNNRIVKTLEEMAQAIFKEWFVNFHFPGHEKVEFIDSGLGRIPKGWGVKNVLEIVKRISVGNKYENKTALPTGKVPILDQGQSGCIGYHNDAPGVVASIDEPVVVFTNHTCNYRLITYPFSTIQNVLPYVGTNGYPTLFVYYLTRGKITMQEYKGHWPEFEQQNFVVPPPGLTEKYVELIKPMVQKMVDAENENQKLAAMRDLLLPKLMSGEISV